MLLDEPTPNSDPTGAAYAFEKGATKASGGEGWADVWRRGRFAWEYKGRRFSSSATESPIRVGAQFHAEPDWSALVRKLSRA